MADRRDARCVARCGTQERGSADIDHLDRLVEAHEPLTDRGRERLHVHDDEVDRHDALVGQFRHLLRHVATGQDPGVDRVVERLDLATHRRLAIRQVGDAADLDPLAREELARPVGRDDLDVEALEVPRELGDALPVRD